MTDNHAENISKHIKVYFMIGGALFVLTVVTVLAALFKFGVAAAVAVGLLIAVVKGSLVALFFMHLSNEKKVIYATLGLTVVFFFVLLLVPLFTMLNANATTPLYVP